MTSRRSRHACIHRTGAHRVVVKDDVQVLRRVEHAYRVRLRVINAPRHESNMRTRFKNWSAKTLFAGGIAFQGNVRARDSASQRQFPLNYRSTTSRSSEPSCVPLVWRPFSQDLRWRNQESYEIGTRSTRSPTSVGRSCGKTEAVLPGSEATVPAQPWLRAPGPSARPQGTSRAFRPDRDSR